MSSKQSPFEELSQEMRKVTVDVAVLATALGLRLPSGGQEFHDFVLAHFLKSYTLPNSGKYALHEVANQLWNSDWEMTVTKRGERLITKFEPLQGGNGEIRIIK